MRRQISLNDIPGSKIPLHLLISYIMWTMNVILIWMSGILKIGG